MAVRVYQGYKRYTEVELKQLLESNENTNTLTDAEKDFLTDLIAQGGAGVTSFNGREGVVVPQAGDYTKAQVGLGNVDNTSDLNKPISTATQTALDTKASSTDLSTTIGNLNKSSVGLENVDNTSDIEKPISTAAQTALDGKASPSDITTAISALTKASVGLANVDNTSDAAKPVSNATQIALNEKIGFSDKATFAEAQAGTANKFIDAAVSKQLLDTLEVSLEAEALGNFLGSFTLIANMPTTGIANGDYAYLKVVDGANAIGYYQWNGTVYGSIQEINPLNVGLLDSLGEMFLEDVAFNTPYFEIDANGVVLSTTSATGEESNDVTRELDALELRVNTLEGVTPDAPFSLFKNNTGLNGLISYGQSTAVGFKSYANGTDSPITVDPLPFSYMPDKGVYQPDSHRYDISFGGDGVPPETYNTLVRLKETKDAGIDTQFTGSDPISNFYSQTMCTPFADKRAQLTGTLYSPVAVTRRVEDDDTILSFQLTSGASVDYGIHYPVDRWVSIEGSNIPEVNGNWKTSSDGNAFTFKITVPNTVMEAPTLPLKVYVYNNFERWLPIIAGEGGQRLSEFAEGKVYWRRAVGQASEMKRLANSFGYDYSVKIISFRQGESNMTFPTPQTTEAYKTEFINAMDSLKAKIREVTGQDFDPIVLCYQTGAHWWYHPDNTPNGNNPNGFINIAQAHYELCKEGHAVFTAPDYLCESIDGIHQDAESSIILAKYEARAVEDIEEFGERRWLYHTAVTQGDGFVDVDLNVSFGDAVADAELMPLLPYWGFDAWASNNTALIDIFTGIEMIDGNKVRISLSRPFAEDEWLSYGRRGPSTPRTKGYDISTDEFGGYGNIHDQSSLDTHLYQNAITATAGGRVARTQTTLRNYLPMFQHQF